MVFHEDLKKEILDQSTVSQWRLLQEARKRGLKTPLESREAIVDWLLDHGLTWREYEVKLNPPIVSRVQICKFFGLKKGWKVLDIGCGIAPTAPAILVGKKGMVVAVDSSEESLKLASNLINRTGLGGTIQLRLGDIMDLTFDRDSFHIALLLYTPQFLEGFQELVAILERIKEWTKLVGIADHRTVPTTYAESIFTYI